MKGPKHATRDPANLPAWVVRPILFLAVGAVFVPTISHPEITVPPGFSVETFFAGPPLLHVSAIALSEDGNLYACDWGAFDDPGDSKIVRIDVSSRSASVLISGLPLSVPDAMLIGDGRPLLGTDLIAADHNSIETAFCCDGRVFRIDPLSGVHTTLAAGNPVFPPSGDPCGLALTSDGNFPSGLYVMDFMGASPDPPVLYRINDDGSQDVVLVEPAIWSQERTPFDIEFGPSSHGFAGNLYVADPSDLDGPPAIWQVTPSCDLLTFVSGEPLQSPRALEFGPGSLFGNDLFVLDHGDTTDTIRCVTSSGSFSVFAAGFVGECVDYNCGDMCFGPDDQSLYVALDDTIYCITITAVGVEDVPHGFDSGAGHMVATPCPFVVRTTIEYSVEVPGVVHLEVFDGAGRHISTLLSQGQSPGTYTVTWDGQDAAGVSVASGVYFARLTTARKTQTCQVVLIR